MAEHPFAQYIRIIGKGPHKSRNLTQPEAYGAAKMIMAGEVEPLQLGAFLSLTRAHVETAQEVAGFVRAVRETLDIPADHTTVDLDWPSYAGKKRHLPWYLMAAFLLANNGITILMQGAAHHTEGRLYIPETLDALGLSPATCANDADQRLRACGFAYLPLEVYSPRLREIMAARSLLGLRTPVHTFARMINPFSAPAEFIGIFHPGYRDIHRTGGALLGQPRLAVIKGEGGEAERRPHKELELRLLIEGQTFEEIWPATLDASDASREENMDLDHLRAVWDDRTDDAYAVAAITGTAALALRLIGRADGPADAQGMATAMWQGRDRNVLLKAHGS